MQTMKHQLIAQQVVLAYLGYYKGTIDGIWGPASYEAKRAYDNSETFDGVPTSGTPFARDVKIPRALRWRDNCLWHKDCDQDKFDELVKASQKAAVEDASADETAD